MKIAVVEATGRKGKPAVAEAAARGHDVVGISRSGARHANGAIPKRPLDIFGSTAIWRFLCRKMS